MWLWILGGVGGLISVILGLNIKSGAFSLTKFIGGFAFWKGAVIGKLLYWGIIAAVVLGVYHKITQPTYNYDTSYRNVIQGNTEVTIDQKQVIPTSEEAVFLGVKLFGLKVGIGFGNRPKVENKKETIKK